MDEKTREAVSTLNCMWLAMVSDKDDLAARRRLCTMMTSKFLTDMVRISPVRVRRDDSYIDVEGSGV